MTQALGSDIVSYKEKLKQLDSRKDILPKEKQQTYELAREQFVQRLKAWEKSLNTELETLNENIEEGYHELEAHFYK